MFDSIGSHELNGIALLIFVICFKGYALYASRHAKRSICLASELHQARFDWMREMLSREVRVADNTAIANLERSVSFFASTTMLILAGLMTILGSTEKAIGLVAEIPFVSQASRAEWELKLVVLIFVFVYAFFKFTWSLRQYGFVTVMIGAADHIVNTNDNAAKLDKAAQRIAKMGSMAAHNFNVGLRTYYFSMSILAWFINPWLFMFCSAAVVLVLYRREFKSSTLRILRGLDS